MRLNHNGPGASFSNGENLLFMVLIVIFQQILGTRVFSAALQRDLFSVQKSSFAVKKKKKPGTEMARLGLKRIVNLEKALSELNLGG